MSPELSDHDLRRLELSQLVEHGRQALELRDYARATQLFREAVRRSPFRHDLKSMLAMALEGASERGAGSGGGTFSQMLNLERQQAPPEPPPPRSARPQPRREPEQPPAPAPESSAHSNEQQGVFRRAPRRPSPEPEPERESPRREDPWAVTWPAPARQAPASPPAAPLAERAPEPPSPRRAPDARDLQSEIQPPADFPREPSFGQEPRPSEAPVEQPPPRVRPRFQQTSFLETSEPDPEPRPRARARRQTFEEPPPAPEPDPWNAARRAEQPAENEALPRNEAPFTAGTGHRAPAAQPRLEHTTHGGAVFGAPVTHPAHPVAGQRSAFGAPTPRRAPKPGSFDRRHSRGPMSALLMGMIVGLALLVIGGAAIWGYLKFNPQAGQGWRTRHILEQAELYKQRGEFTLAIEQLDQLPVGPERDRQIAAIHFERGDRQFVGAPTPNLDGAIDAYTDASKLDRTNARYGNALAQAYATRANTLEKGSREAEQNLINARDIYRSVLKLPDAPPEQRLMALRGLEKIFIGMRDDKELAAVWRQMIEQFPDREEAAAARRNGRSRGFAGF